MRISDNGTDRDMTTKEEAAHKAALAAIQADEQKATDRQTADAAKKQTVLTKLGITADDLKTLLG